MNSERRLHNQNVLLTYGWCRTAYIALKSLAAKGLSVSVADSSPTAMCRFSNLKKRFIRIPSSVVSETDYINFLISVIRKYAIDVYIPVNEEIFPVAKYRDRFPENVSIPIDTYENLMKVHNKKTAYEHALKQGVSVPETYIVSSLDDVKDAAKSIRFPVVIKTLKSQGAKGVFFAKNNDELITMFSRIVNEGSLQPEEYPLIEEFIAGTGYGVECLYDRGQLKAVFTHKRIMEKLCGGGPSTRRIGVKNSLLEEYAVTFLDTLNWHGVAMLEFIYNEETGKGYFLEVNPRFWGSLNLSYISGVDFPYLLYCVAVGRKFEVITSYKTGLQANWLLGDDLAFIDHILSSCSNKRSFLKQFIHFKADSYDDLNIKDILPFFGEFVDYFIKFIRTGSKNPVYKKFF